MKPDTEFNLVCTSKLTQARKFNLKFVWILKFYLILSTHWYWSVSTISKSRLE